MMAGPWTKYKAPENIPSTSAPAPKDDMVRWAEENPNKAKALSFATGIADVMPFRKDIEAGLHAATDFGQGSYAEKFHSSKRSAKQSAKGYDGNSSNLSSCW
jgi:hypothetical protein